LEWRSLGEGQLTLFRGIGFRIAGMRIGELARRARVNLQTVRFYERRGLLRKPARTRAGYRIYEDADLESLVFIKWCQRLGFTLKEVRQLMALHAAIAHVPSARRGKKSPDVNSIIRITQEKIADIDERLKALAGMKQELASAICQLQREAGPVCPADKKKLPPAGRTKQQKRPVSSENHT